MRSLEEAWEGLCRSRGFLWHLFLRPLASVYGFLSKALRRGQGKAVPGLRVISVGNLSMGGSGKSPLVMEILTRLRAKKTALAMRGYGNDESRVYEARFPDLPLLVETDRFLAAQRAAALGASFLILDDGFQRRHELARELDILLLDWERRDLEGHCLPAGRLREPLEAAREADAVVVTHAPKSLSLETLRAGLPLSYQALRVFRGEHEAVGLRSLGGRRKPLSWLRGKAFVAVSGIGRPDAFEKSLLSFGAVIESRRFPDHHRYRQDDLPEGQAMLTTEKDAVKLKGLVDPAKTWILEIRMKVEPAKAFFSMVQG